MRKTGLVPDISDKVANRVMEKLGPILRSLEESSLLLAERIERSHPALDVVLLDMGPNPISLIRVLRNHDIASLAELKDAMFKGTFKVARNMDYKEANDLADKLRFWEAKILIVPTGITVKPPKEPEKKRKYIPFYRR